MSVKAVIFDLDGTLADTVSDISKSCREFMSKYGDFDVTDDVVRRCVGGGARKLLSRLYDLYGIEADASEDEAEYRAIYVRETGGSSGLYPGAAELLPELRKAGVYTAVATMKPRDVTKVFAEKTGLADMTDCIYAFEDMLRPKPDGWVVQDVADRIGISAWETVMVGDSAGDVLTGKNAGGASIGVLWGYGDRAELLEAEADAYVSDMKELMRELLARTKI